MTTRVQRRTGRFVGLWLALGAAMAMGSAAAALKAMASAGMPAVNMAQARLLVGAVALMAVAVVVRRGRVRVARRAWVGLVGTAAGVLLVMVAQRLLTPTSASLVVSLEVVVGAGLAYVILGESPWVSRSWAGR
jgi:drug/metabolite transporter (DMT)-like permease